MPNNHTHIKVIGLQRSGTNYLQELIKINLNILVFGNPLEPFFKHAFPNENIIKLVKSIYITPIPQVFIKNNLGILFVLIKKNRNKWLMSVENYCADLNQKHGELFNNGVLDKEKAGIFYDNYHSAWENIDSPNLIILDYKDILLNFKKVLESFNIQPIKQNNWTNVYKVQQSNYFTKKKKRLLS